jgi:hypothetical protein
MNSVGPGCAAFSSPLRYVTGGVQSSVAGLVTLLLLNTLLGRGLGAADAVTFRARDHTREVIYHSPRSPEYPPRLTDLLHRCAVKRTMTQRHKDHNACHSIQTRATIYRPPGAWPRVDATDKDWPAMRSIVEYLDHHTDPTPLEEAS